MNMFPKSFLLSILELKAWLKNSRICLLVLRVKVNPQAFLKLTNLTIFILFNRIKHEKYFDRKTGKKVKHKTLGLSLSH